MPENRSIWKGLAAGILGGLAASWTMEQFQSLASKIRQSGSQASEASQQQSAENEPATVKAARAISTNVFHHELADSEKQCAGEIAHYVMGVSSGAIYGILAERMPLAKWGFGLLFGTALWAIADETMVPALGLSKSPFEYPASAHGYALASHLVYGVTLDAVRRSAVCLL